jgi:hypothetical protein
MTNQTEGREGHDFLKFVEPGVVETLIYQPHKRGRNWFGILNGKNSVNVDMEFLRMRGKSVDVSKLRVGMAFEIGADYISSGGKRLANRSQYVVAEITESGIWAKKYPTRATAMKARFAAEACEA